MDSSDAEHVCQDNRPRALMIRLCWLGSSAAPGKREQMMYQTILVPLDGSPSSEYVLPLACRFARRTGASLTLIHIHQPNIGAFIGEAPYTTLDLDSELKA